MALLISADPLVGSGMILEERPLQPTGMGPEDKGRLQIINDPLNNHSAETYQGIDR